MITFEQICDTAESDDIKSLDYTSFSATDIFFNLVLQRSEIVTDQKVGARTPVIVSWMHGDLKPGLELIDKMGEELARRAAATIQLEYKRLKPVLDALNPSSIADIGCGYALFDLFFWRDFPGRLLLIDIETSDERHFGYQKAGSAYSNLSVAAKFIEANGVKDSNIICVNPDKDNLNRKKPVDLAVSFLSCGFHYPCSTYLDFFQKGVTSNGSIILDLRAKKSESQIVDLKILGETTRLADTSAPTFDRIIVRKSD